MWHERTRAHRHLQRDPSRPDVHLEAREGVQAIGDFWWLERRGALARTARVILSEWVQGLWKGGDGGTEERHSGSAGPKQCGQWPTSATPRSDIFSVPPVVSSRLPGLMSLCTMPWLCRYSRPSTSWQKYLWGQWRPGVTQRDPRQEATAWEPLRLGKQKGQDSSLSENQGPPARLSCFWAPGPPLVSPDQAALHYASHLLKGHVTHTYTQLWPGYGHVAALEPSLEPGTQAYPAGIPCTHTIGQLVLQQCGGGWHSAGGTPQGVRPASSSSIGHCQGLPRTRGSQSLRSRHTGAGGCAESGVPVGGNTNQFPQAPKRS